VIGNLKAIIEFLGAFREDIRLFLFGRVRLVAVGGFHHSQRYWWHMGRNGERPVMQIVGSWHATNATSASTVRILNATLIAIRPMRFVFSSGLTDTAEEIGGNRVSMYGKIAPGDTTTIHISFFVDPPFCVAEKSFVAAVRFQDDYGRSIIKWTRFHYL